MRIAIFAETYLPYLNGVVTHICVLKKGLEKLGNEVLIVTADPHARHHFIDDGVLHCPAKSSKKLYGYGLASPLSQKRLRMISDFNPDIIHIQTEFGIGLSGIIIAKFLHIPLIYTLHTMYDDYIYYIAPSKLVEITKKLSHVYARWIAGSVNAITGPSPKIADYFLANGVKKQVNIIPNTIDMEVFDPSRVSPEQRASLRETLNIPSDKMIAIFVGRLGKEKGLDVLMRYWAQTIGQEDNIHLLVVGGGPDAEEFKQLSESLGIASMVTFTGPVPHEQVAAYYAISDVFVTASLSEVYSISMLEAMAAGLPVLQRYDPLNASQIKPGVNGYFFNDAQEFSSILHMLRRNSPEDFRRLKESVINSVRDSGAESLATNLLRIYNEFTAKKKYQKSTRTRTRLNRAKVKIKQIGKEK